MRIALTGSSSTGKTTLLEDLMGTSFFQDNEYISVQIDTRSILNEMCLRADSAGCTPEEMRKFQWRILEEKQAKEAKAASFITDRSYLDLAAYWLARVNKIDQETASYLNACIAAAARYTTHIYLPLGRIPFKNDGFRPANPSFLQKVSDEIYTQLQTNYFKYLSLAENDRKTSTDLVLAHLNSL